MKYRLCGTKIPGNQMKKIVSNCDSIIGIHVIKMLENSNMRYVLSIRTLMKYECEHWNHLKMLLPGLSFVEYPKATFASSMNNSNSLTHRVHICVFLIHNTYSSRFISLFFFILPYIMYVFLFHLLTTDPHTVSFTI